MVPTPPLATPGSHTRISERDRLARFQSLQAYYTIAGRDLEREIVPPLVDQRLGLLVWSPLAGGLLSGKFGPGTSDDSARRTRFDFPPVDKDRAWRVIDAIRPAHPDIKLTAEELRKLGEVSALPVEYPAG